MITASVLLLLAMGQLSGDGRCATELFRIERSTNANVVVYETNRTADGRLDPREPVRAEWIVLADDGRREGLTFLERAFAYGFEVEGSDPESGLFLTLKAERSRRIQVRMRDGCPRAFAVIAGREALLDLLFVDVDGGGLAAKVRGVDLRGADAVTGAPLEERIQAARARVSTRLQRQSGPVTVSAPVGREPR